MIHRIPNGTRDVLPDEMAELRAITEALRHGFESHGYGEVYTPALEYEDVLRRVDLAEAAPSYRMLDERGGSLVLRSDMTVPIARLVATRYESRTDLKDQPLRFCYLAHCYRRVRPERGQARELLQAGIELIGAPAPDGTVEALTVLCRTLEGAGLRGFKVGLGDASLFKTLLEGYAVQPQPRDALLQALADRDFVTLNARIEALDLAPQAKRAVRETPRRRGGQEVLEHAPGPLADAVAGMREVGAKLPEDVARRVIFDLGLVRNIGYYTGAIFEVYDPALGAPLGGGGRYDDLLRHFGLPQPAVGFAIGVERLHIALAGEERGTGAMLA